MWHKIYKTFHYLNNNINILICGQFYQCHPVIVTVIIIIIIVITIVIIITIIDIYIYWIIFSNNSLEYVK